jgi:hypothetical protein
MSTGLTQQPQAASGAMAIATSRQAADSQTQMIAAKHYPRDEDAALSRILKACGRKGLAEAAVYSFKKGDGVVEGASIRLAEVLAQSWGNMNCGFTVLESSETESQVMAYAWDLETNTQKSLTFPVSHMRVTKTKSWLLTDPRDIYEMVANSAARRVRACILALIPGDIVDSALLACTATMNQVAGKDLPERIKDMLKLFAEMDITEDMLAARLQTPRVAWTAQQVVAMGRLFVSLRDGFLKQSEIPEFVHADIVPVSQSRKPMEVLPDGQTAVQPSADEEQSQLLSAPDPNEGRMTEKTWANEWKHEAKKIGHTDGDPHDCILIARKIRDTSDVAEMEAALDEAKAKCGREKHQLATRQIQLLEKYAQWRVEELATKAAT